jgi:hypothetical protein
MRVQTSAFVRAPNAIVCGVYADYRGWPRLFRKISAVRLIRHNGPKQVLEIDHVEGRVVNEVTVDCPRTLDLWEVKRYYDARFVNRFDEVPGGTRFTVTADLRFKGYARLFAPLLRGYVRRQIIELQIAPVRSEAEARAGRPRRA